MPSKTPSIIAAILTVILQAAIAVFATFMQMVALNGPAATTTQMNIGAGTGVVCQVILIILAAILSAWLTKSFITRFNWKAFVAVIVSILITLVASIVFSLVALFISVIIAAT